MVDEFHLASRPQSNKSNVPTASNPWPGATKNSIGTFGADGMFRLDGVSDMLLEPRDFDPRAERFEVELQVHPFYSTPLKYSHRSSRMLRQEAKMI